MPVTETFAEFLTRKVRWFVVMSWLLILPAAYRAFAVSMVAGAWIARNSTHQDALHETIKIYLALAVPLLGFVVATVASIVSAEEKHLAASTIALSFWGLVCVGVPLSELVIPRGPQMYDKYVSGQLFRIPWHYAPETDFTKPNGFGFTVGVCPNTPQLGVYDEGCRSAASRVTVAPGTGYENQNGLITCQNYSCRRRIVVDGFVIDYTADLPVDDSDDKPPNRQPANTRWTDADHNLAALVMSWKDGRATSTSSAR